MAITGWFNSRLSSYSKKSAGAETRVTKAPGFHRLPVSAINEYDFANQQFSMNPLLTGACYSGISHDVTSGEDRGEL
jgi:hypothetical protein